MSDYEPTIRLHIFFVETELQVRALAASIAPVVARHPHRQPPEAVVADVRRLLAGVARIVARQQAWRGLLRLHGPFDWTALAAKLALADTALRRFGRIYIYPREDEEFEDEDDEDTEGPDAAGGPASAWQ